MSDLELFPVASLNLYLDLSEEFLGWMKERVFDFL